MDDERAIALFGANDLHIITTSGFFAEEDTDDDLFVEVYRGRWRGIRFDRDVPFPQRVPLGLTADNNL